MPVDSSEIARCLYCSKDAEFGAFNTEHVLPQSFGSFLNSPTLLNTVCLACNTYFSEQLELPLGRDTLEGFLRYSTGIRKRKKNKANNRPILGKKLQFRVVEDTIWKGAVLDMHVPEPGRDSVCDLAAQVGFSKSPNGPFEWHRRGLLPSIGDLTDRGYKKGQIHLIIYLANLPSDKEIIEELRENGFDPSETTTDSRLQVSKRLKAELVGSIDRTIRRAISKIAMNYLAFHYPGIAAMTQFDRIREYIRFNKHLQLNPVTISHRPVIGNVPEEKQVLAHVLTVKWHPRRRVVEAHVSLFSQFRYVIDMADDGFLVEPTCVNKGHLFDPFQHRIFELTQDRQRMAASFPTQHLDEYLKAVSNAQGKAAEASRSPNQ